MTKKTKIQICSDLHHEFRSDAGVSFISGITPKAKILILAGDTIIGAKWWIFEDMFKELGKKFERVLMIPGNHEYYHSDTQDKVIETIKKMLPNNIKLLNNEIETIDGVRFIGGTMWFSEGPNDWWLGQKMSDFHVIKNFRPWVYEQHKIFIDLLNKELKEGDVVITHQAPSEKSVTSYYSRHDLNRFYVHDMTPLILERNPQLWIHGHTHTSFKYKIGKTRVICNPFGYTDHEENPKFNKELCCYV